MSKFNTIYEKLIKESINNEDSLKKLGVMIVNKEAETIMSILADYPYFTHNYINDIPEIVQTDGRLFAQSVVKFAKEKLLPAYQKALQFAQGTQDLQFLLADKGTPECFRRRLSILQTNAQRDRAKLVELIKSDLSQITNLKPDDLSQHRQAFDKVDNEQV